MKRWNIAQSAALALAGLVAAGCTGDTPDYCKDDDHCQDPAGSLYDPGKPQCHEVGHFCYEGCGADKDCTDKSKAWYDSSKPYCDPGAMDCVARRVDAALLEGGVDAGDAALETAPDAGDAGTDATDSVLPDQGLPLGKTCATASECASGFCADKVCCDGKCDAECKQCDQAGKLGTCTFVEQDKDPDGECAGTAPCGGDMCNGAGACTSFAAVSVTCKQQCNSAQAFVLDEFKCDGSGACSTTAVPLTCKLGKCATVASVAQCGDTCAGHSDCATDSLCDRAAAHLDAGGKGKCVDPTKIVVVDPSGANKTIAAGIAAAGTSFTHIRVAAGTYKEQVSVTAGKLVIVGIGAVSVEAGSGDKPVVTVGSGVELTLQGLKLTLAGSTADADGIRCTGTSAATKSTLTVLESTISDNKGQGVEAVYCDVTLRRNTIQNNQGGGVDLSKGSFVVVNNVVTDNGKSGASGSGFGGFQFAPGSGTIMFWNNTVAENVAKTKEISGVVCSAVTDTLNNSIAWNSLFSTTDKVYQGCTFAHSNVQGGATGTGNLNKDPLFETDYKLKTTSPCIDQGDTTGLAAVTTIDHQGQARVSSSGKVDMGAFEAK